MSSPSSFFAVIPAMRPSTTSGLLRILSILGLVVVGLVRSGAQGFASPTFIPVPYVGSLPPLQLVTGDIQGVGHADLLFEFPLSTYSQFSAGELLNDGNGTFTAPTLNTIGFGNITNGQVALADFNGDGLIDLGFVLSGTDQAHNNLCIYFNIGKGAFNLPLSNCTAIAVGTTLPNFASISPIAFKKGGLAQLIVADASYSLIRVLKNMDGTITGFTEGAQYPIPQQDGTGPILTFDLNGDGFTDFVMNGQTGHSASVYLGNGDGTFQAPATYVFDHNVHSLLLADMDGDGHADMIVEGDNGAIEIFHGNADGTFVKTSMGGTAPLDASTGNGGHLIAAFDLNHDGKLDLVTWTPLGISVLLNQGGMAFKLNGIYPAGSTAPKLFVPADYNQDGNLDIALDAPGGISMLYGQADPAPAATLTALPEPSNFEAGFTLTATLPTPAGGSVPTGSVTFSIPRPGSPAPPPLLETVTLQNGVATYTVPAVQPSTSGTGFLPGVDTLTASYSGDSNYPAIASFTGTHRVNLGVTSVTLTPAPPLNLLLSTYSYGQPVNGYVSFFPQDPIYPVTGTWTQLSNGLAVPGCIGIPATITGSCPYGYPQLLDSGNYDFTEAYNGDPINGAGTSTDYNFKVVPDTATSATLKSSLSPALVGTPVTFTAQITENIAVPTGSVSILYNGVPIGTGTLDATGTATLTTSNLPVGTDPISAVYAGNNDFGPATTNVFPQVILAIPAPLNSVVTLTSAPNPSNLGQSVVFTSTVLVPASSAIVPSGIVTFLDGQTPIGTATLSGGIATFSISTLALGTHPITASFGGVSQAGFNAGILPGVSPVVNQDVIIPVQTSYTLTVTPDPNWIPAGQTAIFQVTVTPPAGDTVTPVTLTCGNTVNESVCGFVTPVIPLGGGTTTMSVTTTAPHPCGDPAHSYANQAGQASCPGQALPGVRAREALAAGPILAGLLLLLPHRRRKRWRTLAMLLMTTGLLGLSGCGNCTDLGTSLKTFTITVTGVSSAGATVSDGPPVTQSVTVKLTVVEQ